MGCDQPPFKGIFDSVCSEPGLTQSSPFAPTPPGAVLWVIWEGTGLRDLVSGLELCTLHFENKMITDRCV